MPEITEIQHEHQRLAALVAPNNWAPPDVLAANGAEALWVGSYNNSPEIVELGRVMLESCARDEAPGVSRKAHAAGALLAPFAGIHLAWAEGRAYTADDVLAIHAALEPAVRLASVGRRAASTYLGRAVYYAFLARSGSTDPFMLPGPKLEDAHNSFIVSGGALIPAHVGLRAPHDAQVIKDAGPVGFNMTFYTEQTLYPSRRAVRLAAKEQDIAPRDLVKTSLHTLADALRADYDGNPTPEQQKILNDATKQAPRCATGALRAQRTSFAAE